MVSFFWSLNKYLAKHHLKRIVNFLERIKKRRKKSPKKTFRKQLCRCDQIRLRTKERKKTDKIRFFPEKKGYLNEKDFFVLLLFQIKI